MCFVVSGCTSTVVPFCIIFSEFVASVAVRMCIYVLSLLFGLALGAYLHDTLGLLWWNLCLDPVICVDTSYI